MFNKYLVIYKPHKSLILLSGILFLGGCVPVIPPNQQDNKKMVSIPKSYPKFENYKSTSNGKQQKNSSADIFWNDFFTDSNLTSLIEIALNNNQELKILRNEINIANNEVMNKRGEYYPKLGLGAGYEIEKVGEFTSQGASDATTEYAPGKLVPKVLYNQGFGPVATWEVDIWKRLRNASRSAYLKYLATIEARKYMVTLLVSEIATTYYELIALDNQLEIIKQFIKTLAQAKNMVKIQKTAARSTSLAVKRFEAELLKNQGRLYKIKQKIVISETKLNALIGRFPQKIKRTKKKLIDIPSKKVSAGLPFQLLENRPDIKRALLDLRSAKIDVDVAKAKFYPSLTIDAVLGYQAFNSRYLLYTPESIFYTIGASIAAPLINRNAIKADYFNANNKQIQAIYKYDIAVINAYKEVVNQISSITNLNKIYYLKRKQVKALSESVDISNMLFRAARVNYIESLLTKRDLLESEIELVEVKKEQFKSFITLYRVLGGGWKYPSNTK